MLYLMLHFRISKAADSRLNSLASNQLILIFFFLNQFDELPMLLAMKTRDARRIPAHPAMNVGFQLFFMKKTISVARSPS